MGKVIPKVPKFSMRSSNPGGGDWGILGKHIPKVPKFSMRIGGGGGGVFWVSSNP